ncbi:MAG: hypothetical protein PHT94_03065 [Candidatus Nanoarchaeia archaeon]|nr:hypothetical protein [Candidatus Nanoarchaeia archaeon]
MKSSTLLMVFFLLLFFFSCSLQLNDIHKYIDRNINSLNDQISTESMQNDINITFNKILINNEGFVEDSSNVYKLLNTNYKINKKLIEIKNYLINHSSNSNNIFLPKNTYNEFILAMNSISELEFYCKDNQEIIIPYNNTNFFSSLLQPAVDEYGGKVKDKLWLLMGRILLKAKCNNGILSTWEIHKHCDAAQGTYNTNYETAYKRDSPFKYSCYSVCVPYTVDQTSCGDENSRKQYRTCNSDGTAWGDWGPCGGSSDD